MKHHSIRLSFVIVALALAALIVADLVREARGRRLRETILAALQPVAFAAVAIHNVLADPDLPIHWSQMMMEIVFGILHSAG